MDYQTNSKSGISCEEVIDSLCEWLADAVRGDVLAYWRTTSRDQSSLEKIATALCDDYFENEELSQLLHQLCSPRHSADVRRKIYRGAMVEALRRALEKAEPNLVPQVAMA